MPCAAGAGAGAKKDDGPLDTAGWLEAGAELGAELALPGSAGSGYADWVCEGDTASPMAPVTVAIQPASSTVAVSAG
ncbi:MAG TPA: hypothetical protein VMC02_08955, partial [Steroidobacteraceae bacterium]|nr:hypothetical protein [Steroidobacteraceae bacterium]